jgi:two-component system response regulator MprA
MSAPVVAAAAIEPTTTTGEGGRERTSTKQAVVPRALKASRPCSPESRPYLRAQMPAAARLTTILVVDDSPNLVSLLHVVLGEQGYAVTSASDGESGLASILEQEPDLVILDVGLPNRDGLEVLHELRRHGINPPTLMLTARSAVADRVSGLEAGADDYLVKPFDNDELVARVRALLRRSANHPRQPRLFVGDVMLDPLTRTASRGERELALTQREFSLLEYFMRNAGQSLTRAAIAQEVWRQATIDPEQTNIVDVYVAYLRKKLDAAGEEPMLHTVRGIGYVLRA